MNIDIFLNKLSTAHRAFNQARSIYAPEVSPNFHLLGLFRPNEMTLSRILAWMITPSESHSQGSIFLFKFLDELKIPHNKGSSVHVRVEEAVAVGRLDISLLLEDGRKIVIENKPFASDQPRQLERYLAHTGKRGHVVYLPGNRREASQGSIKETHRLERLTDRRLIESSWIDLIPFFKACRDACHSPRVRAFIDEIPRYIRAEFEGISDLTETDNIIDQMMASAESIESSFLVGNALSTMKRRLITKLNTEIRSKLPSDWSSEGELSTTSGSAIFINYPNLRLRFYLGFERQNCGSFSYGLQWSPNTKKPSESSVAKIMENISLEVRNEADPSQDYPLWSWGTEADMIGLPMDWSSTAQPWQKIANGTASDKIVKTAKAYSDVAISFDHLVK